MEKDLDIVPKKDFHDSFRLIKILFYFALALLVMAMIFSVIILLNELNFIQFIYPYNLSKIGAWGDTLGGVLNPLFSVLALFGLFWTIGLQIQELENTRKELKGSREASEQMVDAAKQQNIETTFFQLFNLLQSNLQTITLAQGIAPSIDQAF